MSGPVSLTLGDGPPDAAQPQIGAGQPLQRPAARRDESARHPNGRDARTQQGLDTTTTDAATLACQRLTHLRRGDIQNQTPAMAPPPDRPVWPAGWTHSK